MRASTPAPKAVLTPHHYTFPLRPQRRAHPAHRPGSNRPHQLHTSARTYKPSDNDDRSDLPPNSDSIDSSNYVASPKPSGRRASPYRSITKAELDRIQAARAALHPPLSSVQKSQLASRFTGQQMAALEEGEEAVNPVDLGEQAKPRRDIPTAISYRDPHGFARVQPVIDKRISRLRGEWDNYGDNASKGREWDTLRWKNIEEKKLDEIGKILMDPDDGPQDDPINQSVAEIMQEETLAEQDSDAEGDSGAEKNAMGGPPPTSGRDELGDLWRQATQGDMSKIVPNSFMQTQLIDKLSSTGDEDPSEESAGKRAAQRFRSLKSEVDMGPDTENAPPLEEMLSSEGDTSFLSWEEAMSAQYRRAAEKPLSKRPTTAERLRAALKFDGTFPDPPEVAPEIPKINDRKIRWEDPSEKDPTAPDDETAAAYVRLSKVTGQSIEKLRSYKVKFLVHKMPVNQTRMGKIRRSYYLAVAGDGDGMLGLGEGKAIEADEAMRIARLNAIRNMVPIRRYEQRTIYGEVSGKVGACELTLNPLPPGYGLRCSHNVFEIAKAAGIRDLRAKVHRSRRPMNVCKAVWEALKGQRDPEDVARARGRKMVDVRKVYYAGLV